MRLEPGRRATFRYTVTDADTAAAVGGGEVPVLATPRVLALAVASSSRCASVTATGRWPAA